MKFGVARVSTPNARRCGSCGAEVIWAVTDMGARMPINPEHAEPALFPEARKANLVLWFEVDDKGRPVGQQHVSFATNEQRKDAAIPLWVSHFTTCPSAARHRMARR